LVAQRLLGFGIDPPEVEIPDAVGRKHLRVAVVVVVGDPCAVVEPLRHPDAIGPQHPVERTRGDLHLVARLGADHDLQQLVDHRVGEARRVEQRLVGADRAEILPQARPRLISHGEVIGDDVEIGVALALAHLRAVHAVHACVDADGAQVLNVGVDDAVEERPGVQELHLQRLARFVAQHPVIAGRPAGLFQKRRGAPRLAPVEGSVGVGRGVAKGDR
jgi:hypothetical protein